MPFCQHGNDPASAQLPLQHCSGDCNTDAHCMFETLGSRPTSHRLLWLADMDSTIAASHLAEIGSLTPQASLHFLQEPPSSPLWPGHLWSSPTCWVSSGTHPWDTLISAILLICLCVATALAIRPDKKDKSYVCPSQCPFLTHSSLHHLIQYCI